MGTPSRSGWDAEEDAALSELVKACGDVNPLPWAAIAKKLSSKRLGPPRTGKQARSRFNNHLSPDVRRDPWTVEEEATLFEAHAKLGPAWAKIASMLPGRTDNQVCFAMWSVFSPLGLAFRQVLPC